MRLDRLVEVNLRKLEPLLSKQESKEDLMRLLYAIDSPSASNSRGFSRGSIFDSKGNLIASVAQEGLMRILSQGAKRGTI